MPAGGGDDVDLDARALIADGASAALVATDGTIDWWCPQAFDHPAALFKIVDPSGGAVRVSPADPGTVPANGQRYDDDAMTVRTRLPGRDCVIEVRDGMPWDGRAGPGRIVRLVTVLRGPADVIVDIAPGAAFGPARDVAAWSDGASFDDVVVRTGIPMAVHRDRRTGRPSMTGRARLDSGEQLAITIEVGRHDPMSVDRAADTLDRTATAWRQFAARFDFEGRAESLARRSALVIRSLTATSGAPVAAPTTSLPQIIGGSRNRDGRLVRTVDVAHWAALAASVALEEESHAAADWLAAESLERGLPPAVVTGALGGSPSGRRSLGLRGWRRSEPVNEGEDGVAISSVETAAAVLIAITQLAEATAGPALLGRWDRIVDVADWLADHWDDADAGAWFERGPGGDSPSGPHTIALLEARRGLTRIHEVAMRRNPLDLDAVGWHAARRSIEDRLDGLADAGRGALAGGTGQWWDSAVVRAAWLGPWPADDRVVAATLDRIRRENSVNGWLLPYNAETNDGMDGRPPPSIASTLELARASALAGRWDDAYGLFELVTDLAGPLGLLPEAADAATGAAAGNRPWVPAHLALIETALALAPGPR